MRKSSGKNRKPAPRTDFEKAILRRQVPLETVFEELRNPCQSEPILHRSGANLPVNLMGGIMAYPELG